MRKMKLISIIVLAALLLVSNCVAIPFIPTTNDMGWMNQTIQASNVIISDIELISFAAENSYYVSLITYCDLAATDLKIALEDSQQCAVSSELLEAKFYYEQSLSTYIQGSEKVSLGLQLNDASLISQGIKLLLKGSEYMMLSTRALKTVQAPTYASTNASTKWVYQ